MTDALDELIEKLSKDTKERVQVDSTEPKPRPPPPARKLKPVQPLESPSSSTKDLELPQAKLFSEEHPRLFKATRMMLPRLGPVILTVWLLYAILMNLARGDIAFAYRWFHDNELLQTFIQTISSKAALLSWLSLYGVLAVALVSVSLMMLLVFHRFLWRFLFKDYIRFTEGVETTEGRTYWIEGWGSWFDMWDSHYQKKVEQRALDRYVESCLEVAMKRGYSKGQLEALWTAADERGRKSLREHPIYHPEKRPIIIYLKVRRWPLIPNPMNPGRSLWKNKLAAGSNEALEKRGPYELIVHEGKYRRITGVRLFATHNEPYSSASIPTLQATSIFKDRVKQLISDTNELSKANVKVRLDKLRTGTVLVDPEIRDMTLHERKEKAGT